MIQLEHRDDIDPICPFCTQQLQYIAYRELRAVFGRRYLYFCPSCRSALGFSHRKGFWMG
jgi:hypothetical protein